MNEYASIGIFYGGCNNLSKKRKTFKKSKSIKKKINYKKYKTIKFSRFLN